MGGAAITRATEAAFRRECRLPPGGTMEQMKRGTKRGCLMGFGRMERWSELCIWGMDILLGYIHAKHGCSSTGFHRYLQKNVVHGKSHFILIIFARCVHTEHGIARPSTDGQFTFMHDIICPSIGDT